MIQVSGLTKVFRVPVRRPGLWGALKGVLSRKYVNLEALKGISFSIGKGELIGYIGPNGAGKSTSIKILSGILVPTAGTCRVAGFVPWKDRREYVGKIGVIFGQRTQLWWDLPVIESFELLRDIYSVPASLYRRNMEDLCANLDLEKLLDHPVRQLSLGQRMRCDLAASLLHSPEILFLDEPTIGLDAVAKLAIREFIRKINREQSTTVILTTHDMDDIEALCERILLIGKGEILFDGPLSKLRESATRIKHLVVDLRDPYSDLNIPGVQVVSRTGARIRLAYDPAEYSTRDLLARVNAESDIIDLTVENPPVEETIAALYRKHSI